MKYRCNATSVNGFMQQLAVCYVRRGYCFYVQGEIPEGKNLEEVDSKLIGKYGIAISKHVRTDRKKNGLANMQYIRYKRVFVLAATKGEHYFFTDEPKISDVRNRAIQVLGHEIGLKNSHASVQIPYKDYKSKRSYLVDRATHWNEQKITGELLGWRYITFQPVRRQLKQIMREVNNKRKAAGLKTISLDFIPKGRKVCRPFEPLPCPTDK